MSCQRNVLDDTWWPVYLVAGAIDWYGSKGREKTQGQGRRGEVCSLLVKYARSFSPLCVDFIQSYLIFIVVPRVAGYSIQRYEGTRATFNYRRARGPSYVHLALQTRYQRLYAKRLHAPEKFRCATYDERTRLAAPCWWKTVAWTETCRVRFVSGRRTDVGVSPVNRGI